MEMAKNIVVDAKADHPAACNAMETLLVHKELMENCRVDDLLHALQTKGVSINGGPRAVELLQLPAAPSFNHEYGSLTCTLEIVVDVRLWMCSFLLSNICGANLTNLLMITSGSPPLCSICQHKAPIFGKPPRWFSYDELDLAINNGFSQDNSLATGILPDGHSTLF